MRDLVSCFSEHAIRVIDPSCSGAASRHHCAQNVVACTYIARLAPQQQFLITVTWCKNVRGQILSVNVDDDPTCVCKVEMNSWQFWKKKGCRSFQVRRTRVDIHWDISSAKFRAGPEPVANFHLAVVAGAGAGAQIVLLLGDIGEETARKKYNTAAPAAESRLAVRREYVTAGAHYSTKTPFVDHGAVHNLSIKCRGDETRGRDPELSITIDHKKVVHVKQLHWKFRGNQTVRVDGLPVDIMWDVHDWFFNSPPAGDAVFMFMVRTGSGCRFLNEENLQNDGTSAAFSLLISASKNR